MREIMMMNPPAAVEIINNYKYIFSVADHYDLNPFHPYKHLKLGYHIYDYCLSNHPMSEIFPDLRDDLLQKNPLLDLNPNHYENKQTNEKIYELFQIFLEKNCKKFGFDPGMVSHHDFDTNTILFLTALDFVLDNFSPSELGNDFLDILEKKYEKENNYNIDIDMNIAYPHLIANLKKDLRSVSMNNPKKFIIYYYKKIILDVADHFRYSWVKKYIQDWKNLKFIQSLCLDNDSYRITTCKENKEITTGTYLWGEAFHAKSPNITGNSVPRWSIWVINDDNMYELIFETYGKFTHNWYESNFCDLSNGKKIKFTGSISNKPYYHPLFSLYVHPVYFPQILNN